MSSRWAIPISLLLVAFTGLVLTWQIVYRSEPVPFIVQSFYRGEKLAKTSSIVDRDRDVCESSASDRNLDLILPPTARVFVTNMTGPTNYSKVGYYYYLTYYLFPREVAVSIDQSTSITKDGFPGGPAASDEEIGRAGYDVIIDLLPDSKQTLRTQVGFPLREPANPDWFASRFDTVLAFLLPGLTALAGMWLFRFLFPTLARQMPPLEQLAYGLGLGMMAVAALTLGIKLCGLHGYRVMFLLAATGGLMEMIRSCKLWRAWLTDACGKLIRHPALIVILVAGAMAFLILFRLAGLQGLVEYDAIMAWALKAKIIHLYTGNDIVRWFSTPRLTGAHLDYPTLVPSLHAATYDSLGHVDEFVTKFWSNWMLLLLLGALASLNGGGRGRFYASYFAVLSVLLLPAILCYVQMEGGTMPMIFFTALGFVQCGLWLVGRDRARLGLGLTLLFGAAMAKFEGFIFLALVCSWMLLLPAARPSLKPSRSVWRVLIFCLLAAIPYLWLRVRIPALNFESGWAGYALHHPINTLSNWPGIFVILLARFFVASAFASWSGIGGQLHWIGRWDGPLSLIDQATLGLPWLCLLTTIALWFAVPARRQAAAWMLAMLIGALAAFSLVFASFISITNLGQVVGYTSEEVAGRYLLPVLIAWFATAMTLFFGEQTPATPAPGTDAADSGKTSPLAG